MPDDECWAVRAELAAREREIETLRGAVAALRDVHQKEAHLLRMQDERARSWVSARVVVALLAGGMLGAVGATATLVGVGMGASPATTAPSSSVLVSVVPPGSGRDSGAYASSESGQTQRPQSRPPSPSRASSP
jgi:hypothetical protein